ncbi:MAG: formylglycine-generating enzyme family protein [Bacteroidota bacterium]
MNRPASSPFKHFYLVLLVPAVFLLFQCAKNSATDFSDGDPAEASRVPPPFHPFEGMVTIEGGSFKMGCTDGKDCESDELPPRKVSVKTFRLDKCEVTNAQFTAFLNAYGSDKVKTGENAGQPLLHPSGLGMENSGGRWKPIPGMERHPATFVTWFGASEYARFFGLRLPTEEEWEFAAKGGKKSENQPFAGSGEANLVAWSRENSEVKSHPVGSKQANALGIFDLSGNVWEWTNSSYQAYPGGVIDNPCDNCRTVRGGSWNDQARLCRVTNRDGTKPGEGNGSIGFRCAGDL